MHAYLCRTDVCASLVTALAFQFQFCNFGSCQVALSLQLSVQLTRCLLLPATCLLPPPFLRVEAARPRPLAGNSQAFLSLPTLLLLLLPTLLPLINLHGQQICAAAVAPFVPLSPLLRRLVQRFSCSRLVGVCVCVEHVKCMSPVKLLESLCISLPLSPLYLSCIAAVGPTFVRLVCRASQA